MNLVLKELVGQADDVIIVISSLTKDITGKVDAFRSNAIRLLARITDAQLLAQVDRFLKAAIVDREPSVASAALVSGIHLAATCPEVVRRWLGEVQEAAQSRQAMVQYHALGLIHALRRGDRLAVTKLVSSPTYSGGAKSSLAQCLLIRFAKQVLIEGGPAGIDGPASRPLVQYLETCLRHPSDMVVLEAARALCELPGLPAKQLVTAVADLQLFLNSSKSTLRFAAVRTLNTLASSHPGLVSACNADLETLAGDSNRSVATLAISCLLKTGTESSVDRLVKLIGSFIGDVPDEFKVQLVEAIRALCFKFEGKAKTLLAFLSSMLREEGGIDFKSAIVRAIVSVSARSQELCELALAQLCEFIEDCEFPALAAEVLELLAEKGPALPGASKYVRYVYNRTALENVTVRAAAVAALAKFGLRAPGLRSQVVTLLGRCAFDGEDDVRDRAVFYLRAFQDKANSDAVLSELVRPTLGVPIENLITSLEEYLSAPENDTAFDIATVPTQLPEALLRKQQQEAAAAAASASAICAAAATTTAAAAASPESSAAPTLAASVDAASLQLGIGMSTIANRVAQIPALADLGMLWHASPVDLPLTEKETEYVVSYRKFTFPKRIALEFTITNTIHEQQLENVRVVVAPSVPGITVERVVAAEKAPYGTPAVAYAVLRVPENVYSAKLPCTLKFVAKEVDENTGDVSDAGDEDEYPLDEAEITVGDFVQPACANFDAEWEKLGDENQAVETYNLSTMRTLDDAVKETISFLGMAPLNGSSVVCISPLLLLSPPPISLHALRANGGLLFGEKISSFPAEGNDADQHDHRVSDHFFL